MFDALIHDLRQALRALRARRRFTVLALAAFTVGIGSNVAAFRVLDDAFFDALPWPEGDRTVLIWETYAERGLDRIPAAPAKYLAWREHGDIFESVAAYRWATFDLLGPEGPERIEAGVVDPRLFRLLGLTPVAGRLFTVDEERPAAPRVAVLSHGFWQRRFGGDPAAIGNAVVLDGEPYEVVGVLPPGDAWPDDVPLYVQLEMEDPQSRAAHAYRALARLAPGVGVEAAQQRVDELARLWAQEHPETDRGFGARIVPLRDEVVGDLSSLLLLLQGAVGLVLIIACANAATLLLVSAATRRREMAVRASLGASPARLRRQLVAESMLLALGGAVLGLPLSGLGVGAVAALSPRPLPGDSGALDGTVLLFTLAIALGAGLLFGLLPAARGTAGDLMTRLREGGATPSRERGRARAVIVGTEVAVAAVLLVGSALLLRSLDAVSSVDPGFKARGILVAEVQPPRQRYTTPAERAGLYGRIVEAVATRPDVQSVDFVSHMPIVGRTDVFRFLIEGRERPASMDELSAEIRAVTPGYFRTMDIEVRRGRGFRSTDNVDGEPVVVLDEAMVRRYWPGTEPLGARISLNGEGGPWLRVVGVVEEVRHGGLTAQPAPSFYVPMDQEPWPAASLVVRSAGEPLDQVAAVRAAVAEVDPLLPLGAVRTGREVLEASTASWRFQAVLVGAFGVLAAALAILGVYGLLSYAVQERLHEMGIRRALGAASADVRRLVRWEALRLALPGVTVGLVGGALAAALLRGMLFGVPPRDPWSYAAAGTILTLAALGASWWPGRRASRVEPVVVLRGK